MPGEVRNVGCPDCGGVLNVARGETVTRCDYCGGKFFSPDHLEPSYLVPPVVSREAVGECVRRGMKALGGVMTDGDVHFYVSPAFLRNATLSETVLYFVPFFRYSAIRAGTTPFKQERDVRHHVQLTGDQRGEGQLSEQIEIRYKLETRVVLSEVGMVIPAVDAGAGRSTQWGLRELLDESRFLSGSSLPLEPFRRERAEREGIVLQPFRSCADVKARCREMYRTQRTKTREEVEGVPRGRRGDPSFDPSDRPLETLGRLGVFSSTSMDYDAIDYSTDIVDDRVAVYYCPLWKVTLKHDGKRYEAFMDAARGRLLSLEVKVGGPVRPHGLFLKALLLGQANALGFWLASLYKPSFFGLAGFLVLASLLLLYRDAARSVPGELPSVKVLDHGFFKD
ncbi:MAG: hypothetical protein KA419_15650 [Acidobacteria bacterium]|nr:hypothetical protein [Acidobacteriota bacterium]